ncbi:MAG: hypothetical protein HJJLKODD_02534 [Phycisphaerae bacterium]|nr:hypothetical protein [Phycisphaerae bacterium]
MEPSRRFKLVAGFVGLVIVLGLAVWYVQQQMVRAGKVTGTIKAIDITLRQATLEFTHPKNGTRQILSGEAAPDCVILIDNQPAEFSDLRVGDVAQVEGNIHMGPKLIATRVQVQRASTTSSAPSSSPASQPVTTTSAPAE